MPNRCVAANCGNKPDLKKGIVLHAIPYLNNENPTAKKRRRQWVKFVQQKRARWEPSATSTLCSKHFKPEDYARRYNFLEELGKAFVPRLIRDEIGEVPFPTIHADPPSKTNEPTSESSSSRGTKREQRSRAHRKLLKEAMSEKHPPPGADETMNEKEECEQQIECCQEEDIEGSSKVHEEQSEGSVQLSDSMTQTEACRGCRNHEKTIRHLRNQVFGLRTCLRNQRNLAWMYRKRLIRHNKRKKASKDQNAATISEKEEHENDLYYEDSDHSCSEDTDGDDAEYEVDKEDYDYPSDIDMQSEPESDESEGLNCDGNMREEPKHIVFLSKILALFSICFMCKADSPMVVAKQKGTMLFVTAACKCGEVFKWRSQPDLPGTKIPAGNILLSMGILCAGGSFTKFKTVCSHIGLACISRATYFSHQKERLFPTIYLYWKKYQKTLIDQIKANHAEVVMAGDGRHDSMGHSAKYGAYTMFCCTMPSIVHFELVQKNEAGSSQAMELLGFQRAMDQFLQYGINMKAFVSDQHLSIAKHMREDYPSVCHFYDLWHLKKRIRKLLFALAKEKDCEIINEWIKPCTKQLHWSATTTTNGDGRVIIAKFKAFLSHILDKHEGFPDPVFNKCAHKPDTKRRAWLEEDSIVYEKLAKVLTNKRLMNGIEKASPFDQTSSLEGFHSVLNHFAPKMIAFSHTGMVVRHCLASVHFNANIQRGVKVNKDGTEQVKVTWPKFLNGEAVVKNVRVAQNFSYVNDIFNEMLDLPKEEIQAAVAELHSITPEPMNRMLQRQSKEAAIAKRNARKLLTIVDVPPTMKPTEVQKGETAMDEQPGNESAVKKPRKKPTCLKCKVVLKGHKCPYKEKQSDN